VGSKQSGLIVPADGTVSDLSTTSTQTYLQIKEKALALESLYADCNLKLPSTCYLARLIADAKMLSDLWLTNHSKLDMCLLLHGFYVDRIAEAVLPIRSVLERDRYLNLLTCGSLDLLGREKSNAKNCLWELELWSTLCRHGFDAALTEPPDITILFEGSKIGIACKKIYSEKHVQNVLSQAVSQIESAFELGIVAINLDDLLPAHRILRSATRKTMSRVIRDLNARFFRSHERHFRKYLACGRVIAALVSPSLVVELRQEKPSLNNAGQSTIWIIPGLEPQKEEQANRFRDQFMDGA